MPCNISTKLPTFWIYLHIFWYVSIFESLKNTRLDREWELFFLPFHHFPQDCLFHHPHSSTIFHICHISPQTDKIFGSILPLDPKCTLPKSDCIWHFSTDSVCDKYEVCELNDQSPPEESHCGSRAKGPILDQGLICQVIGIFYQKQYDRIISWSWYINYCSHPGCGDKSWIFTNWHPHSLNGEKGCEVFLYFCILSLCIFVKMIICLPIGVAILSTVRKAARLAV